MKNPYENIDAEGNLLDPMGARSGNLHFQNDELLEYIIPRHKYPIEYFKILHHDLYESEKRYLPNIILTVTKNNEVFLWQENILNVILSHLFYSLPFNSLVCMSSEDTANIRSSMQPSWNSLQTILSVMSKFKPASQKFLTPHMIRFLL